MRKPSGQQNRVLDKIIRSDGSRNRRRDENHIDLTKPSVILWLTMIYVVVVSFIVVGVPWMGVRSTPIPPDQLPVAIPVFIVLYVVVIGGFYLRDRFRK